MEWFTHDIHGPEIEDLASHPNVVRITADVPKTCTSRLFVQFAKFTSFFSPTDGTPAVGFQDTQPEYDVQHTRDRFSSDPRLHEDELRRLVSTIKDMNAHKISVEDAQSIIRQMLLRRTNRMDRVAHPHARNILMRTTLNPIKLIWSVLSKYWVVAPSIHNCGPQGLHDYMNSGLGIHWLASIVSDPTQDIERLMCSDPVTTFVPRVAARPVTTTNGTVIPEGAPMRLMIGQHAKDTGSVDFLFSTGPGTRVCPFGVFMIQLMRDVKDYLLHQDN